MTKRTFSISLLLLTFVMTMAAQDIQLPKPKTTGGMPLMEALSQRQSNRDFSEKELSNQTLSNLLWAAWGYNRPDKRTAPSSRNKQELELYVVMKNGSYLYDAKNNLLKQVSNQDNRKAAGMQPFVSVAPVNIIYVSDKSKGSDLESSHTNSGFISQNIYLFCASEGLITVVRGMFDAKALTTALSLNENQVPILAQTVGYKK